MMEYIDFYDIAEYGNANWKGSFTPREIACYAYDYLCSFRYSKMTKEPAHSIKELLKLLKEDGSEECLEWVERIEEEIGV